MTENDLSKICGWMTKGAKLYIGRDPAGRSKIKIVRGPLGLFTQRYHCDDRDLQELSRRLKIRTMQTA